MSSPSPNRKYYLCTTTVSDINGLVPNISGLDGWTVVYLSNSLCVVRDPLGIKNFPEISTSHIIPDDLPLEVPVGISQNEADILTSHFGFDNVELDKVASGRVGGK